MKKLVFLLICIGSFTVFLVNGQNYPGKYFIQTEKGRIVLSISKSGQNSYQGSLSGNDNVFELTGSVQNGILSGTIGKQGIVFQAQLTGDNLSFIMAETDAMGNTIQETAQLLSFRRQTTGGQIVQDQKPSGTAVIINGQVLGKAQIGEIKKNYGVAPKPGNYWYDTKSGLYGVVGYPAFGFMLPDHKLGALRRDASNGHTGVIINKRELAQAEWLIWSYLIGYWIQPGNYWLDHKGNAGYEGNPTPLINLFVAARQNAYNGKGGAGDNFWSTRFSAGNSSSGNQQGYVSVPGYGPVGYGF